jgi:hypothetical protein
MMQVWCNLLATFRPPDTAKFGDDDVTMDWYN